MALIKPNLPDFDPDYWKGLPYGERLRLAAQDWAVNGFGTPLITYVFYVIKFGLYVLGWALFAANSSGTGSLGEIGQWWAQPVAFQKAILWTLAFEGLGLGCGSGPLTGRFWPPFSAVAHFVRPNTVRLPPFPKVPFTSGDRRTPVDAALYVGCYVMVFRALLSDRVTVSAVVPVVALIALAALRDKTIFLAMRGEHYWTTLMVLVLAPAVVPNFIAGSKVVQLALWWGAGISKMTHHFPSVITVMVSNSPAIPFKRVRKAMYRDYPDDLRASPLAERIAHVGTLIEFGFPFLLCFGRGGWMLTAGLGLMLAFHLFIVSSIPMGVPIEWNLLMIYSAFALFGVHREVAPWQLGSVWLALFLVIALAVVPVVGNLVPSKVSFLPSMRYYAGNWAYSVWLFGPGATDRLDERMVKASPDPDKQASKLFDETMVVAMTSRALAFRSMHLHGRALHALIPQAVGGADRVDGFTIRDGELVAGMVLGWNFGDGHLHHEQLLAAVQKRCSFAPGEVRCVFVESQPLHRQELAWRINDAATGPLAAGTVSIAELRQLQPWPTDTGGAPGPSA